jgi:hypothetical protein
MYLTDIPIVQELKCWYSTNNEVFFPVQQYTMWNGTRLFLHTRELTPTIITEVIYQDDLGNQMFGTSGENAVNR